MKGSNKMLFNPLFESEYSQVYNLPSPDKLSRIDSKMESETEN